MTPEFEFTDPDHSDQERRELIIGALGTATVDRGELHGT
jgi:hypothetical protein